MSSFLLGTENSASWAGMWTVDGRVQTPQCGLTDLPASRNTGVSKEKVDDSSAILFGGLQKKLDAGVVDLNRFQPDVFGPSGLSDIFEMTKVMDTRTHELTHFQGHVTNNVDRLGSEFLFHDPQKICHIINDRVGALTRNIAKDAQKIK